jgi:hypothetical protein
VAELAAQFVLARDRLPREELQNLSLTKSLVNGHGAFMREYAEYCIIIQPGARLSSISMADDNFFSGTA